MEKIKGLKNKSGRRFKHEMGFIRQVVRHYETSDLSTYQIGQIYGVPANQVTRWKQRFSSELSVVNPQSPTLPMTAEEQKELDVLKKQNEELLKKLELATMKITSLETMIDVAEQEYRFDIRKKPGTKQSKD